MNKIHCVGDDKSMSHMIWDHVTIGWMTDCVLGIKFFAWAVIMAVIRDSVGLCDVTKSAELIEIEPFF